MRIGVPKETLPGEARVALVPAGRRRRCIKAGLQVAVEQAAGVAAGFPDAAYRAQGATVVSRAEVFATSTSSCRCAPCRPTGAALGPGGHRLRRPARRAAGDPRRRRHGRDDAVDGADAAHHARAEHGRTLVDGHRRRLQGRAARRQPAAAHVPDADDGGRHRLAGARVHRRRGRGRPPGDRVGATARREGRSLRRAAGGQGAGAEPRARGSSSCRSSPRTRRTRAATPRPRTSRSTAASAR